MATVVVAFVVENIGFHGNQQQEGFMTGICCRREMLNFGVIEWKYERKVICSAVFEIK
mgnify:CR=1 FL=1